jgi:hypothetical protein
MSTPNQAGPYVFILDGAPIQSSEAMIRGLDIRNHLPEAKRDYGIFEEGIGDAEDKQIQDHETITLSGVLNPKRFYSVPPANFGQ